MFARLVLRLTESTLLSRTRGAWTLQTPLVTFPFDR